MSFGAGLNVGVRDGLSIAQFKHQRDNQNRRTRLAEAQFEYGKTRDRVADAQFQQQMQLNNERLIFDKDKFEKQHKLNVSADARLQGEYDAKMEAVRRKTSQEDALRAMDVFSILTAEYGGDTTAMGSDPRAEGVFSNLATDDDFLQGVGHLAGLSGEVKTVSSTADGFYATTADGQKKFLPNDVMFDAATMFAARNGIMNNTDLLTKMQQQGGVPFGGGTLTLQMLKETQADLDAIAAANNAAEPEAPAAVEESISTPVEQAPRGFNADIPVSVIQQYSRLSGSNNPRDRRAVQRLVQDYPELSSMSEKDFELLTVKQKLDYEEKKLQAIIDGKAPRRALGAQQEKVDDLRSRYEALGVDESPAEKPKPVTAPLVKQAEQKAEKMRLGKLQIDRLIKEVESKQEKSRKDSLVSAASYMALSKQNGVAPDMEVVRRLLAGDSRTDEQIAADKVEMAYQIKLREKLDDAKTAEDKKAVTERYAANKAQLEDAASALAVRMYGPEPESAQVDALRSDIRELLMSSEFANVIDMNDMYGTEPTKLTAAIRTVSDAVLKNKNMGTDLDSNQIPNIPIPDSAKDVFEAAHQKGGVLSSLSKEEAFELFMSYVEKAGGDHAKAIELLEEASRG